MLSKPGPGAGGLHGHRQSFYHVLDLDRVGIRAAATLFVRPTVPYERGTRSRHYWLQVPVLVRNRCFIDLLSCAVLVIPKKVVEVVIHVADIATTYGRQYKGYVKSIEGAYVSHACTVR